MMAELRMLVVLDNARHSDQVRALLLGTAGCIDVLPDAQARAPLSARLGADRVAEEPATVDRIIAS